MIAAPAYITRMIGDGESEESSAAARRTFQPGTAWLMMGLLLVHAAFWVGPFGVLDLYEYAQNAESLWLDFRWDMHLPQAHADDPAFSRFSIGLPILSGPFVYLGQLLEWLSAGAIGRRWILALIPPLATVFGAVLVERIGALLAQPARACRWAAIIFALSGSALYYSRFYYVEPVVGLMALIAMWAFLVAWQGGTARARWLFLAGLGAGAAVACHYAEVLLIAGLGMTFAVVTWRCAPPDERWRMLAALALAPLVIGLGIAAMNWHCFGHPLVTGYTYYDRAGSTNVLTTHFLARNLRGLATVLLGVPWVPMVVVLCARAIRRAEPVPWRWCAAAVLAGVAAQESLWLAFKYTWWSPLRYHVPLITVAAVGLPMVGAALRRRWPERGLGYATIVLLVVAAATFLGTNDFHRPFVCDPEDPLHPGQVTTATWYARRAPYHAVPGYFYRADGTDDWFVYPLSPVGSGQVAVLASLLVAGALCLGRSWRKAPNCGPREQCREAVSPTSAGMPIDGFRH